MTDADKLAIEAAPPLMLAEWWCQLNQWNWPREGLGEPEPTEFIPGGRRWQIMSAIMDLIGISECLREWNKNTMTASEFIAWWDSAPRAMLPPNQ